jgi:hypothetical protein
MKDPRYVYVVWGTKIGAPSWQEEVLYEGNERPICDAGRTAGYDRIRVVAMDMTAPPDFTGCIRKNFR